MDFYSLIAIQTKFAEMIISGTKNPLKKRCSLCRVPFDRAIPNFISPIQIQFVPASTKLGDFAFCIGAPYPVISKKAKDFFEKNHYPCTFETVEVLPPVKKKNTVPFPINEPLYLLKCTSAYRIDFSKSEIPMVGPCKECGRTNPAWFNNEKAIVLGDKQISIFLIEDFMDGATYVTESMVIEMQKAGLTNIEKLIFIGEIFSK